MISLNWSIINQTTFSFFVLLVLEFCIGKLVRIDWHILISLDRKIYTYVCCWSKKTPVKILVSLRNWLVNFLCFSLSGIRWKRRFGLITIIRKIVSNWISRTIKTWLDNQIIRNDIDLSIEWLFDTKWSKKQTNNDENSWKYSMISIRNFIKRFFNIEYIYLFNYFPFLFVQFFSQDYRQSIEH